MNDHRRYDEFLSDVDPAGRAIGGIWHGEAPDYVVATTAESICHSLDAIGRPICGAELTGDREPHPIGICWSDEHRRCGACDDLMDIDGGDPALLEGAWPALPRGRRATGAANNAVPSEGLRTVSYRSQWANYALSQIQEPPTPRRLLSL